MKVAIFFRNSFTGGDGWTYYPMTVEIADTCPVCGGKRGAPRKYHFCEDGEWFTVDKWDNPCGHVDLYRDCYFEAEKLKAKNKLFKINKYQNGKLVKNCFTFNNAVTANEKFRHLAGVVVNCFDHVVFNGRENRIEITDDGQFIVFVLESVSV